MKRIMLMFLVKLLLGAVIFVILSRFTYPEKTVFNEGTISAFIGFSIYMTGETIWKYYKRQLKKL